MAIINVKTLTEMIGEGKAIAMGDQAIQGSATTAITTGMSFVEAAWATVERAATTPGTVLEVDVPSQTSTAVGTINARMIAAGGSTNILWLAIGRGKR